MSDNKEIHLLEGLYTREIKLNEENEKKATKVLDSVLKTVLEVAKVKSETF